MKRSNSQSGQLPSDTLVEPSFVVSHLWWLRLLSSAVVAGDVSWESLTMNQRKCVWVRESIQTKSSSHRQLLLHFFFRPTFFLELFISAFLSFLVHPLFFLINNNIAHTIQSFHLNRWLKMTFVWSFLFNPCSFLVRWDLFSLAQMVGGWTSHHKSTYTQGSSFLLLLGSSHSLLPAIFPSKPNSSPRSRLWKSTHPVNLRVSFDCPGSRDFAERMSRWCPGTSFY